jgi:hypothetical protein
MIVAQLNLPLLDNAKRPMPQVHLGLVRSLIAAFGGATSTDGRGYWVDEKTGELFDETVRIYTVAIERHQSRQFLKIAQHFARKADQLALYTVIDGKAEITALNAQNNLAA